MIELPGYSIHRELSSDSRTQVFLATQMSTGRDVVVKVFDPDTGSSQFDDEAFIQETSIIASMNHPHVIPINDYGMADEIPFVVMEYLSQGDLNQKLQQGLDIHDLIIR